MGMITGFVRSGKRCQEHRLMVILEQITAGTGSRRALIIEKPLKQCGLFDLVQPQTLFSGFVDCKDRLYSESWIVFVDTATLGLFDSIWCSLIKAQVKILPQVLSMKLEIKSIKFISFCSIADWVPVVNISRELHVKYYKVYLYVHTYVHTYNGISFATVYPSN